MKAKSLLLTALSGLTFLSSPAGAECWMTCPPGSTATPSPTGVQGATATAEPTLSPEEPTQGKKPEAMAKAAPTPVPAKPKAVPATAGATTAPPPYLRIGHQPKGPKRRPRPRLLQYRRSRRQFRPPLRQVPLRNLNQSSPRGQHQRRRQLRMQWHHRHLRHPLRETQRSSRDRLQRCQRLCQSQAWCPALTRCM